MKDASANCLKDNFRSKFNTILISYYIFDDYDKNKNWKWCACKTQNIFYIFFIKSSIQKFNENNFEISKSYSYKYEMDFKGHFL